MLSVDIHLERVAPGRGHLSLEQLHMHTERELYISESRTM